MEFLGFGFCEMGYFFTKLVIFGCRWEYQTAKALEDRVPLNAANAC